MTKIEGGSTGHDAPVLTSFEVTRYKAFARPTRVDLGRLTILLGRNNAGKTSLAFAPLFFTHAFRSDAVAPFPQTYRGIDFCRSLQEACFNRQLSGLHADLNISHSTTRRIRMGAASLPEQNQRQVLTELFIEDKNEPFRADEILDWPTAKAAIERCPDLQRLANSIQVLLAQRPAIERVRAYSGGEARGVGPTGEFFAQHLANAKRLKQASSIEAVNNWMRLLGVEVDVDLGKDTFEILVRRRGGNAVNIADVGAGIPQVLPLVVAFKLAPQDLPRLLILEQPEIDLHPNAHAAVAQLLLDGLAADRGLRILVETHSDALVLRIRREIAARQLAREDVRVYFVDDDPEVAGASLAEEIPFNDRGTPSWWPKGVFAESQTEFYKIRQALAARGRT